MRTFCHSAEDAKLMWCPFVRIGDDTLAATNRPSSAGYQCVAGGCMAWRWVETHVEDPDGKFGELIQSGNTHGYCGLAGDPQ